MDALNNTYIITSIVLSILLTISEVLGWAKCDANSITQLHRCITCAPPIKDILPTTGLVADDWSQ
jgi:hypothetical protein